MVEAGSIGSRVCSGVRWSCWMSRRRRSSYQRLRPPSGRPAGRGGVRLGRRAVLASTSSSAWRFGRLRRRGADARWWPSPLRLLHRIVDAYVNSLLSRPLKILRAVVSPAAGTEPEVVVVPSSSSSSSPPPTKLRRREASPQAGSTRRRDSGGGRGVMLNICVAEALLLRRSTSEVRRSPLLQQPRKAGRCASVRA